MPWVEVECPRKDCAGREESHGPDCACKGTKRREDDDVVGRFVDCDEGDVVPHRWLAFWFNTTLSRAGEWGPSISCSYCGEEGEEVDDAIG